MKKLSKGSNQKLEHHKELHTKLEESEKSEVVMRAFLETNTIGICTVTYSCVLLSQTALDVRVVL
eukprot:2944125-Amphidinium_carterae.1